MTRGATESRVHRAVQSTLVGGLVAAACLVLASCNAITQTPFQRTAREAAGTLAAAAETLTAVQEGRLTEGYARASFVSFAEAVQGVGEQLPSEDGAPGTGTTVRLGRELQEVELLLRAPCLHSPGCDASAQIRQLTTISRREPGNRIDTFLHHRGRVARRGRDEPLAPTQRTHDHG